MFFEAGFTLKSVAEAVVMVAMGVVVVMVMVLSVAVAVTIRKLQLQNKITVTFPFVAANAECSYRCTFLQRQLHLCCSALAWAMSQHTDTSKNTKATLKCCCVRHFCYVGTISSRDNLLA